MPLDLLDSAQSPRRRENHANLKRWTRELLELGNECTLTISELRCAEPDCPDLETVIGISVTPGQWHKLRVPKPSAEVTRADLAALVA